MELISTLLIFFPFVLFYFIFYLRKGKNQVRILIKMLIKEPNNKLSSYWLTKGENDNSRFIFLFLFLFYYLISKCSFLKRETMKKACEEGNTNKVQELLEVNPAILEASLDEVFFFLIYFCCFCFSEAKT